MFSRYKVSQSPLSPDLQVRKERLLRHEVGHFVAALALGFPTGGISISIRVEGRPPIVYVNGGAAISLPQDTGSQTKVRRYLARRIAILYAGACAETLKPGTLPLRVDLHEATKILGSENDFAKAGELIHLLRNVRHAKTGDAKEIQREIDELNDKLWRKAAQLVEQNGTTIISLAGNLKNRGNKFFVSGDALRASPEFKAIAPVAKSDDLLD
jgi:hypothetical protein